MKGSSSAPAAPDPTVTAAAQASANADTARLAAQLNRTNTVTPQGTVSWTNNGDQWTQTVALSPQQQAMYNATNTIGNTALTGAQGLVAQGASNLSQPLDISGLPKMVTGIDTSSLPHMVGSVDAGNVVNNYGDAGPLARTINTGGLASLPAGGDFAEQAKQAQDAAYQQAAARLDPQWQQQQSDLESRLASQGIALGSSAYDRAMKNFNMAKNDAYSQAQNLAVQQGNAQQQQLFGENLQSRQQGFGEGLAGTSLWNQTEQQANDQAAQRAGFANTAQQQLYGEGLSNANLANAVRGQAYNEAAGNASLANSGRQNSLAEQSWLQTLPLQQAAMLMGMGQVQGPQYGGVAQVGVSPTDVEGPTLAAYQGQLAGWQNQQNQNANLLGGLVNLGGTLGGASILASDEDIKDVAGRRDPNKLLAAVLRMPVRDWKYQDDQPEDDGRWHIGPMAQDYQRAGLGDGKTIHMADAHGLLMGAVQALANKVQRLEARA